MLMRDKIAAVFTSMGILGLAMSPFVVPATANVAAEPDKSVSIAITSGPQLQLIAMDNALGAIPVATTSADQMVCHRVFRLPIADVGLRCDPIPRKLASISDDQL